MAHKAISLFGRSSLTRISVSGKGDHYLVRTGDERPMRVWMRRDRLECECGAAACGHIAAITMCGFVEQSHEGRAAA